MKVLVDTCIWSKVFRHKNPDLKFSTVLKELISDGRVAIIGPIRQELLSGISEKKQFKVLKEALVSFKDIVLRTEHFEKAAEFNNLCRNKGVQGSTIDFLICSVAYLDNLIIYTTDNDFKNYQKHLPIHLFEKLS